MSRSDGSTADYYVLPEGATQLQDLISHRDMNSQIGEIFRACYRYGIVSHSDKMRDAKKIRFYAQAEVERLEKLEFDPTTMPIIEVKAEDEIDSWDESLSAPKWAEYLGYDHGGATWFKLEPVFLDNISRWANGLDSRPDQKAEFYKGGSFGKHLEKRPTQ